MDKDLAYYEANPEEATVEVLEQLASASMGEDKDEPAKLDETGEAQAEPESVTPDAAVETGKEASEEAPIVSRDGKHTIPFDVLRQERESRQRAEQMVRDLNDRVSQLQNRPDEGVVTPGQPSEPAIGAEEMAVLREDFPAFANVIEAQMAKIAKLETQVSTVSSREAEREADVQRTVQEAVRDAIDASPKLLKLEADQEAWETVVAIDNAFKQKPEFRDLSLSQRFEKVVQRYEAVHGPVDVPAAPAEKTSSREKAAALLNQPSNTAPRSLSDLPGGLPDAGSEKDRAENMSTIDMGLMMQKMTPAQIDAYLNQL